MAHPANLFSEGLPRADSLPEVAIAGKCPGLRELLDKHQIHHRDVSLKTPDALPPGSIVIAEIPPYSTLDGFFPDTKSLIYASATLPQMPRVMEAKSGTFLVNATPPEDFRESPFAQRMLFALLR